MNALTRLRQSNDVGLIGTHLRAVYISQADASELRDACTDKRIRFLLADLADLYHPGDVRLLTDDWTRILAHLKAAP